MMAFILAKGIDSWRKKLFLGKHHCTLDRQNRMLAPRAMQDRLTGGLYLSQGFDRNLLILTASAFQEVYRRVMSLNLADPLARLLLRLILGSARELEMKDSGQLSIPSELMDFAGLEDEAMLIGMGDYIEIWSLEAWNKQEEDLRNSEQNASRFAGLVVATR